MKKLLGFIGPVLLAACLLAGCGAPNIPEGMETARLEADAKALIEAANLRDYGRLAELFSPRYPMPPDQWAAALNPYLDAGGAFVGYKNVSYTQTENQTEGVLALVLVEAEYQNLTRIWTVSFTADYEAVGFLLNQ